MVRATTIGGLLSDSYPDGELVGELPDVSEETLLRIYRTMVQSREFDEKTLRMQCRGEVSIMARATGEEAVSCGSAAGLEEGDWCFPSYRQTPAGLYWGSVWIGHWRR